MLIANLWKELNWYA